MARKIIRLKTGDVFYFKNDNDECGIGQIIVKDINEYIVVYQNVVQECDLDAINLSKMAVLLGGWTSNSRFNSGDWHLLGNSEHRPNYEFPQFKIKRQDVYCVVDPFRNKIRDATQKDIETLSNPFSWSPIAYEKAFWAFHRKRPWEQRYQRVFVDGKVCELPLSEQGSYLEK